MKLNLTAFALASAICSAICIIVFSGLVFFFGYARGAVPMLQTFIPGYSITIPGTIIGAVWSFAMAYLWGLFFAAIYNAFASTKK